MNSHTHASFGETRMRRFGKVRLHRVLTRPALPRSAIILGYTYSEKLELKIGEMSTSTMARPVTLAELRSSGWQSKTVKQEIHDNFLAKLQAGDELYPGIVGYDDTVIPELNIAILAQHDMLFMGEKGQAKSRLMRLMTSFLDDEIPYIDDSQIPVHDDPLRPITRRGRQLIGSVPADEVRIGWWRREHRYAERLAPGTKFADIIGEIDPAKLAAGVSMGVEDALHFGLIPRMHRGIFAMNELPELDELVQVGLF